MKKSLLATTAIAALGAVAVATPASAKFEVSVSGYMEQWFGYSDNKESVQPNSDMFDQLTDSEFFVNFKQKLDNGLDIGGQIQVEGQQGSAEPIDEQFIYINGSFGRFEIGTDNGAQYRMHYGIASHGIGIDEGDVSEWIPGAERALRATNLTFFLENDANKLTYFSPRVNGFQFGATYIPENDTANTPLRTGAATGREADANRDNGWQVGANYVTSVADMSIKASMGYVDMGNSTTAAGDQEALSAGIQLGFGGFTASVAYGEHNNDGASEDINNFGIGLGYKAGPAGVSVGYIRGEDSDDNEKQDSVEVGASYAMGPGVTAKSSVYYVRNTTNDNVVADGVAVVGGLALSF
jgi:predicted porin